MNSKIDYFLTSLEKKISSRINQCPYCKSNLNDSSVVDRKFLVTSLVSCKKCKLLVRTPTDDVVESDQFYQQEYSQGYTTDCPSDVELTKLIASRFVGTERDYSRYLRFFEFLGISKSQRFLDFGCSWGYGLSQVIDGGYLKAEGFEVSVPRARYGMEKLKVPIHTNPKDLSARYDTIFSSHVLEHLPDFALINKLYNNHLNPGGYFVAITPNGSNDFKNTDYNAYHSLWGKVHPVLLCDAFVKENFKDVLHYLDSWNTMDPIFKKSGELVTLDKYELVFVLRKPL